MVKLTSVQAADMAGISRSTIWRACKSGKLSAERSGKDWLIDVAELERVYGPLARPDGVASSHETSQPVAEKPAATSSETDMVAELRRRIETLERHVQGLEEDKADLRTERDRLMSLVERQADHVRLLTDQRQPAQRAWWRRLVGS
jgi:excisionase family DNA binding protein